MLLVSTRVSAKSVYHAYINIQLIVNDYNNSKCSYNMSLSFIPYFKTFLKLKACPHCTLNAHWMHIQCGLIPSTQQMRKTKLDGMRIESIQFRRWIETGLEWNVSICVVACLQFRPISATTQRPILNVRGVGKDMPTCHSNHLILWGHAHIS